jgi:hypothetical protein
LGTEAGMPVATVASFDGRCDSAAASPVQTATVLVLKDSAVPETGAAADALKLKEAGVIKGGG